MQGEPDARAVAGCTIDSNAAAVRFDDALCDREPEADPGRITVRPDAVKTLEQSNLLLGRDPRPLVLDANAHHVTQRTGDHTDKRLLGTVLRRIRQQSRKHLALVTPIGHHRRHVLGYVDVDLLTAYIDRRLDHLQGVG